MHVRRVGGDRSLLFAEDLTRPPFASAEHGPHEGPSGARGHLHECRTGMFLRQRSPAPPPPRCHEALSRPRLRASSSSPRPLSQQAPPGGAGNALPRRRDTPGRGLTPLLVRLQPKRPRAPPGAAARARGGDCGGGGRGLQSNPRPSLASALRAGPGGGGARGPSRRAAGSRAPRGPPGPRARTREVRTKRPAAPTRPRARAARRRAVSGARGGGRFANARAMGAGSGGGGGWAADESGGGGRRAPRAAGALPAGRRGGNRRGLRSQLPWRARAPSSATGPAWLRRAPRGAEGPRGAAGAAGRSGRAARGGERRSGAAAGARGVLFFVLCCGGAAEARGARRVGVGP